MVLNTSWAIKFSKVLMMRKEIVAMEKNTNINQIKYAMRVVLKMDIIMVWVNFTFLGISQVFKKGNLSTIT
ncbi:hypothetical protein D3C81_1445330 [compost metagenome]